MSVDATVAMRQRLADTLTVRGVIGPAWRPAVERVPRHLFVPRFYEREGQIGAPYVLIDGKRSDERERYLQLVYDPDESLVIEYDPDTLYPTSSATMPSIVLAMLEDLDVEEGNRVLEIGTGSAYSTALLSARLGSANVVSVDIGREVVELARQRLMRAGFTPTVVCDDGFEGYSRQAPYDRIISTCKAGRIPKEWVVQARSGSIVLALLPDSLVKLVAAGNGSASGRFTAREFGFMRMRGHSPIPMAQDDLVALASGNGASRRCNVNVRELLEGRVSSAFWPVTQLLYAPFCERVQPAPRQLAYVATDDHSWFRIQMDTEQVTQGGPRRLWDSFEALFEQLAGLGHPDRTRFGLTVRPDGSQFVWLDSPDSEHCWELVARAG